MVTTVDSELGYKRQDGCDDHWSKWVLRRFSRTLFFLSEKRGRCDIELLSGTSPRVSRIGIVVPPVPPRISSCLAPAACFIKLLNYQSVCTAIPLTEMFFHVAGQGPGDRRRCGRGVRQGGSRPDLHEVHQAPRALPKAVHPVCKLLPPRFPVRRTFSICLSNLPHSIFF